MLFAVAAAVGVEPLHDGIGVICDRLVGLDEPRVDVGEDSAVGGEVEEDGAAAEEGLVVGAELGREVVCILGDEPALSACPLDEGGDGARARKRGGGDRRYGAGSKGCGVHETASLKR